MARYDAWRFGSAGGRYVDQVERATVLELLAGAARAHPRPAVWDGAAAHHARERGLHPGHRRGYLSRFEILRTASVLALPSLAYRFLPGPLVPAVAFLERRVPAAACTKVFFLARRIR